MISVHARKNRPCPGNDIFSVCGFFSPMSLRKCIYVVDESRDRSYSHPCSVTPRRYIHVPASLAVKHFLSDITARKRTAQKICHSPDTTLLSTFFVLHQYLNALVRLMRGGCIGGRGRGVGLSGGLCRGARLFWWQGN